MSPIDIRYLTPSFFQLSKSTYIKGLQCLKYLYLNTYKPALKTPRSPETVQKFAAGKSFEQRFKQQFEPAEDIAQVLGKDVYTLGAAYTSALLANNLTINLLEACFVHYQTLVMTDVLVKDKAGIHLYEVKHNTTLKSVFVEDMALQYYVCAAHLGEIASFNLVLNDGAAGFTIINLKEQLVAMQAQVEAAMQTQLELLKAKQEPAIAMGEQCTHPYECEFMAYCKQKNSLS